MIINTGQRTDIPAFYADWFYNRIREGYVLVRNPYYPNIVTRYALNPEVVDIICFCTKNPVPMLSHLHMLRPYHQFWMVTLTPYGKEIEPHVPDKRKVLDSVRSLSEAVGKKSVCLRYDPILLNEKYTVSYHIKAVERLCASLEGYTEQMVISFIDLYEKTKRNFPAAKAVGKAEQIELCKAFSAIGRHYGIHMRTCCEDAHLQKYGMDVGGCMTKQVLEEAIGEALCVPHMSKPRAQCACLLGNDIGAYNSCMHLCKYCYANTDKQSVMENHRRHDPHSPLLIGRLLPTDTVKDAAQSSFLTQQLTLE